MNMQKKNKKKKKPQAKIHKPLCSVHPEMQLFVSMLQSTPDASPKKLGQLIQIILSPSWLVEDFLCALNSSNKSILSM